MKTAFVWLMGLIILLIAGMVHAETVYYWTDENGVRHFSNTGAPADVENVGTEAGKTSPPESAEQAEEQTTEQTQEQVEQENEKEQDEILSDAPDSGTSTLTVREQAEKANRERVAKQAEDERRRLEAEISQVEGRGLSRTFTEGMRNARLDPLKEQLSLLDADPVKYFSMKREGSFAPGREQSSNRQSRPRSNRRIE